MIAVLGFLVVSWLGMGGFGLWLYYDPDPSVRWWDYVIAISLGWFWVLPIVLYPFVRNK